MTKPGFLLPILLLAALGANTAALADAYAERRLNLVRRIEDDARSTAIWSGRASFDARVLEAMARVPRHVFVPEKLRRYAYENRPLPIGFGQTISQPYIVALMTDLVEPAPGRIVLEVGTGSGYQAALLADLGMRVYTMEIIEPLAEAAKARLEKLGYGNVTTRWGDGYDGWPEQAPFDAIIVTAAASHIPPPLLAQLKPGGRMVIPVGGRFLTQQLVVVEKDADGRIRTRQILPVRFVPLRRKR
ncbi:MAG: protein-L-isoaspartate(D-aspartate) O-methyltransferase [Alphaproteobacteria bacterium]